MSNLKYDKTGMTEVKEKFLNIKNELQTLYSEINNNLDMVIINWKGKRSEDTFDNIEEIKKGSEELIEKLDLNIDFLDNVIQIFDKVENASLTQSTSEEIMKLPYLIQFDPSKLFPQEVNGEEFLLVNTQINPIDYGNHVFENDLWEKGANGGKCLMVAQYYAMSIMEGEMRSFSHYEGLTGSPSAKINKNIKNSNVEKVKEALFEILNDGFPAVIKVSTSEGGRHFVTAIGYRVDVTNPSQLTEENILVIDNATGKVSTLFDSGYGNRSFYKEDGEYEVIGPNDKFVKATDERRGKATS